MAPQTTHGTHKQRQRQRQSQVKDTTPLRPSIVDHNDESEAADASSRPCAAARTTIVFVVAPAA